LAWRLRKSLEVHTLGAGARQVPPRLLAREREDRRHEARQRRKDVVARRLRGAAARIVGPRGVEAVLDDVEVERREVHGTEVVDRGEDRVELVLIVGAPGATGQGRQAGEGPALDAVEARARP